VISMAGLLNEELHAIVEELQMIRNCLTILCYYTGKNFFSNEPTLEEVKEMIKCI
jgi:hypothetical protein